MELFDISAEQASLGSMLMSRDALINSFEVLESGDFYKTSHRIIFQCIKDMFQNSIPIDVVTLTCELKKQKQLEKIGGVSYLTRLIESVPTPKNIEHYNAIIKEKSNQRKVAKVFRQVKAGEITIDEGIQVISSLPQTERKEETFHEILTNTLMLSTKGTKYRFKMDILNKYLGGVDASEVVTIGGYTSMGKSDFAIQLAIDFADNGIKVLFLSSEMTGYEIGRRILANLERKNIMDFRKGIIKPEEVKAMKSISEIIGKEWNFNIQKISNTSDIMRYIQKYQPDIVFVDYLQNLSRQKSLSDYQRTTENMHDIQSIALKEEIVIFVLSQLSRKKEGVSPRPKLSDLRDSGRIEELSNIVILLYWENRIKEKVRERIGGEEPEQLEVLISKNRAGTIGRMYLDFYPEYCRIQERVFEYEDQF